MAKLYFKVGSDWEEVVKLRNEISKLKQELKSMDSTQSPAAFKTLNTQLAASTQRMDELVTNAAKAGAVMEGDFKKKIFTASQSVNGFIEKIITQKAVVKDVEADVKRLGEAYRSALKNNPLSANSKLSEYASAKKALDEEKAALFGLTQEQANARLSVKKLRDEYALYKNDGKQVVETNDGMAISWKRTLAVIGGVGVLKALVSEIIRVRGEFQSMQTAMETMVGKDVAGPLMAQVKELAKISPLTMTDMVGAEKMMLGFNIQAEDTIKYLKALSDISMGESGKFNSLTLAFSQMSASGKLMGQDLNQMINAGFNPLQTISEKTGKSIATLKDEMSKGAISAEMVQQAFLDAASAGGKFYNMSENASKTINGQISMMHDALDEVFNELGTKGEGVIMSGIKVTTSLIQNYETIGKILAGLAATYGIYRTAVMLVTAAESKHTLVEIGLTNVRVLARKAQLALNASMLTNPYVLLAVAVGGLITANLTLIDTTRQLKAAEDDYNKTKNEAIAKEQEYKAEIDKYLSVAENDKAATRDRKDALVELVQKYPAVFEKYKTEAEMLQHILEIKKQINAIDNANSSANPVNELNDVNKQIADLEKLARQRYHGGRGLTNAENSKLEMLKNKRSELEGTLKKEETNAILTNLTGYSNSQLEAAIKDRERLLAKMQLKGASKGTITGKSILSGTFTKEELEGQKKLLEATKAEREAEKKSAAEWLLSYKKAYDNAEKAYKDFLSSKKIMSDADRDKELKRLKDLRDTAKATYERKGGSTSSDSKQEKEDDKLRKKQEKYNLLIDKQNLAQKRMGIDTQHEKEQIEINGLQEGSEKVLRQRKLNHEKELEAIKREAEDKKLQEIEKARSAFEANPDNKGKSFDVDKYIKSEPVKKQFTSFDKIADAKTKTENTKYNRGDDLSDLLNQYQDYTDKRLAIETKFNKDIATLQEQRKQAVKNGDTEQVGQIDRSIAQATKNKGMELMGLDYDKLKESPEYVRAFENLKETSSETLNSLLTQLEKAKSTAAKVLSPDQLREYTSTIQSIMDELDSRNPFQSLSDKKKELAEAEEELANAQIELENAKQTQEAVKGGAKIENGISSSKFNPKTGKIDSTKAYLTEAQALDKVKDKTDKYNKSKDKVVATDAKVKKAEKDVKNQIDDLFNAMDDLGKSVGGQAGEIISLISDIGSFTMFAMEGVKAAADTSANAISTVEKASVILAIISAAVQVATKIAKLFKGESDEEKRKKQIDFYNKIISIYDKIIEKQKESIKFGYGFSSIEAAKNAMEDLNKRTEYYRKIANTSSMTFIGVKSLQYIKAMKELGVDAKESLLGIATTDELSQLSAKQLEYIRNNYKDLWASLKDEQRDALQAIIDAEEKSKEIVDEWKESITGVSYDSFYTEFIDTLSDMDSSAEDMANNFGDYLRKSILAAMVAKEFQKDIDNLYEMWVAAGDEKSDKGIEITEDEARKIQEKQKKLTEAMIKRREEMEKTYGWDSSSSSQESTKKGFATASQDSIDELNGRFTAGQIAWEETKNQNILQSQSLNILTVKADSILSINTDTRNIADEIRTIQANSFLELQGIRENTGAIIKPIKDMAADIAEVKKNTSKL